MRISGWIRSVRVLRFAAGGALVFVIGHALIIALVGSPAVMRFGDRLAFGSNGLAIRAQWDSTGRANLDMTVLGNSLRVDYSRERLFLQLPIPSLFLILFLLFTVLHLVERWAGHRGRADSLPT